MRRTQWARIVAAGITFCLLVGCRGPNREASRRAQEKTVIAAVVRGDVAAVKTLLDAGASVESRNDTGRTVLMLGALKGQEDMVVVALAKGADINARDLAGMTALMWAAFGGNARIVQTLLAKGADVNATDKSGETALDWGKEHPEVVRLLKQAGAKEKSPPTK